MCKIKTFFPLIIIFNILISNVSANEFCYSSSGVFGIIIVSVIITIVVIGLALGTLWFLWTKNRLKLDFILNRNKKNKTNADKKSDLESANHDYAFDNPYFQDQEDDTGLKKDDSRTQKDTIILLEGKEIASEKTNEGINHENVAQDKQRNGQMINNRFVKSLPLSTVFNNVPVLHKKHKQESHKSMDDYFIRQKPEKLEVELIGHDFTGLGFNICGNMKDGIFIKDVQNKGPANESGKVKAGDRIISVNVCFEKMVYEDAVSILSYASPYNVRIELEKSLHYHTIDKLSNNLIVNKNIPSNSDKQLLHPLYRSHSADDLTRLGKELSLSQKSTSSAGKNVVQKIKSQIFNRKSNTIKPLIDDIVVKSSNIENETEKSDNSLISVVKVMESQGNEEIVKLIEPQIVLNEISVIVLDETDNNLKQNQEILKKDDEKVPEGADEKNELSENQVIKKVMIPAKRKGKAPQPPIVSLPSNDSLQSQTNQENQSNGETIETTAQVHNEEIQVINREEEPILESENIKLENYIKIVEINGHHSSSTESISAEECDQTEDLNAVPLQSNSPQRVQSPTGKPKSSSMSDLTINNQEKLQCVLLERAVSLDMNAQNLPEENLYQHPKNLLVTYDENADSMPIINWNISKQSDTDSSESTLNEVNQAFIINNELSDTLENFRTNSIGLSNHSNENINENNDKLFDDTNFVSHIDVEPHSSTPVRINEMISIDQFIHSSSSSDGESEDHTIIGKIEPILVSISSESKSENRIKANEDNESKEVIELSESELDGVMMSHKAFLIKQAKLNGSYPNMSAPLKAIGIEPHLESLDFESWSYLSEDDNYNKSHNESNPTLYTTALDISDSNDSQISFKPKKLPEVAGITLKTGENGQMTNTVIITTNDLSNSSFSSTSSSPPSN